MKEASLKDVSSVRIKGEGETIKEGSETETKRGTKLEKSSRHKRLERSQGPRRKQRGRKEKIKGRSERDRRKLKCFCTWSEEQVRGGKLERERLEKREEGRGRE